MVDTNPTTPVQPKATLKPEGTRLLLLISSMSGSLEVKTRQSRIRGILDGLLLPKEQVEVLDGSDPAVKPRRLELFIISGKRAQYPQLFLVKPQSPEKEEIQYLGNAEEVFYLHDTDTLGDAIGLSLLETPPPLPVPESAAAEQEENEEEEDDGPVIDKSLATAWVRTKSTRNITLENNQEEKEAIEARDSEDNEREIRDDKADAKDAPEEKETPAEPEEKPEEQDAKPPTDENNSDYTERHQHAATKIQFLVRHYFLPVLRLRKKLKNIQKETKKKVERTQKDATKKIAKIQKQFDKDCKKVDKLAKDIRRQQRKEKQLKKDMKSEKKLRDKLRKKNKKERDKAKKCDKVLRNLDKERKHLATWDKDIATVQAENERLLALITKISEEISMRGVNWIELTATDQEMEHENQPEETKKPTTKETAAAKKETEAPLAVINKATTKAATPAPARVPQRRRLKSILERQDARTNMLSLVRQESQRLTLIRQESKRLSTGSSHKKSASDNDDAEVAPVFFVRLNSRARLLG